MEELRPEVIFAMEEPFSFAMAQIVHCSRRLSPKPRLVCQSYQNILKKFPFPWNRIERRAFRSIDLLVGANPEVVEVARRKAYTGPADVLPTPVDTDIWKPGESPSHGDSSGEGLHVGYVGRFVEEKGIDTLFQAAGRATFPLRLTLVGDGPLEPWVRAQGKEMGCGVSVRTGLNAEEIAQVYPEFDCVVLPSRTRPNWKEQFGRVLTEAMSCGVSVIGSDSGAIPWVLGEAGIVFPEGDAQALLDELDALARNPDLRQELGRKGRRRALERFSTSVVMDQLVSILQDTLPVQVEKD
jgi:glycosyltransferase involved in cell wall biosynthesis